MCLEEARRESEPVASGANGNLSLLFRKILLELRAKAPEDAFGENGGAATAQPLPGTQAASSYRFY